MYHRYYDRIHLKKNPMNMFRWLLLKYNHEQSLKIKYIKPLLKQIIKMYQS